LKSVLCATLADQYELFTAFPVAAIGAAFNINATERKGGIMATSLAVGTFDVALVPIGEGENPIGTMSLSKTFAGDIVGSSTGLMLSFRSAIEGSAGYVAMERVTGHLAGKAGAFTLQHSGSMERGVASLSITVVPDSATGDLHGLTGKMEIIMSEGRHDYKLEYTLSEPS
jgi:Protein of unknown function (DUF3224)